MATKPSLPDLWADIKSNGIGYAGRSFQNVAAAVGISSLGSLNEVIAISEIEKIVEELGYGPLANAVADALAAGAPIVYAVPADTGTDGTNGSVTPAAGNTGDGAVAVAGTPADEYEAQVKIVKAGVLGTAAFRFSLDGGRTWSDPITVPAGGDYVIPNTGITATFSCTEGFDVDDLFSWETTPPVMSTVTMGSAVDALLASSYRFAIVHVVGPGASAMWVALDTKAGVAATKHKYLTFIAEGDAPGAAEETSTWVTGQVDEAFGVALTWTGVVAARCRITCPLTGQQRARNVAGIYVGWLCGASKTSESPAWVGRGSLPMILEHAPADFTEAHIVALDAARYVTVRQFEDLQGYYFTNGWMMVSELSDFRTVENRRVMNYAAREARIAGLPSVQGDADALGQAALVNAMKTPLKRLQQKGELVAYAVQIPAGQDVLGTGELTVKVGIQPKPKARWIRMDIGFTPDASAS